MALSRSVGTNARFLLEEGLALALEARCKRLKQSDLVFPTRNGKANGKHRLALTRVAKNAGMDDSRFWLHKFRATAATNWLRGGIDLRTVQCCSGTARSNPHFAI